MIFKKINIKKAINVCSFMAMLLIFCSQAASALTMPWNKEGKFVKIQEEMFAAEEPIELPDGNVAFPPNYILNTKTYKLEKTDKKYFSGIKLKDGTILTAKPSTDCPYANEDLRDEIYSYLKNSKNINPYYGLDRSSDKKRLGAAIPHIQDNPELLKKYNDYVEKFEKSMYGIISNQETGEYRQVGKMKLRREGTKTISSK